MREMQSTNIFMNTKRVTAPTATTHRRSSSSSSAAQACAACKYQRRKCAADCLLAPYFPHERQRQFLNAHRLFGVSNIVKIVRRLDPPAKDAAMRTIVFQSEARAADPAGGCHRIIQDLEHQIDLATAELQIVLHHLALCRAAAAAANADNWRGENDGDDNDEDNDGIDVNVESSSSFNIDHDHDPDLKIILDNISKDGDDGYKFDCHQDNLPSNHDILTEENATFKEENGQFSYIQDENELKSAAANSTLTNSDEFENIENKF